MKKLVLSVLLVQALILLPVAGQATVTYYNDETTFLSALQPGYYTETFGSLTPGDQFVSLMSFSEKGFSYDLSVAGSTFYSLPNALSTNYAFSIQGSNFAPTTGNRLAGIGGYFYMTDAPGNDVPGTTATLTVNGDTPQSVSYPLSGPRPFFGAIDPAGITTLIFDDDLIKGGYATISNLTVGAVVSVPPGVMLLGSGLLGLVGWRRFRKD